MDGTELLSAYTVTTGVLMYRPPVRLARVLVNQLPAAAFLGGWFSDAGPQATGAAERIPERVLRVTDPTTDPLMVLCERHPFSLDAGTLHADVAAHRGVVKLYPASMP